MCLWHRLPIGGASQSLGRRQSLNRLRPCGDRVKTAGARQANVSRDTIARRAMASAVVLALASAQAADAGAVSIVAARDGEAIDIRASALVSADAGTPWRVLTDYDHYPDFVPDLQVSRIVARNGAVVTVEQSGAAVLGLFKLPLDITFGIQEMPPRVLVSRVVAGSLRQLTSRYALRSVPGGARLDYVGRVVPGFEFLGRFEQTVVEQNVGRQFQALADEIERRGAKVGVAPMAISEVRSGSE